MGLPLPIALRQLLVSQPELVTLVLQVVQRVLTSDHLDLGRGDLLICDSSEKCIADGATSAIVLTPMHKRGVQLFYLPRLDAKVVQLPHHVLLGSANMTARSLGLREASVLTNDPGAMR